MYHLPESAFYQHDKQKLYWPTQVTGATTGWQTWLKPPGSSMLQIICIGSGAGGGGGHAASAGGGGGGGSSGISRYLYPMWAIPDSLYILVGAAGTGGATGSNGANGQLSYVSLYPNTAANNLFAVSGAAAATGGTSAAPGIGGPASTIATNAGAVFSCWAITKYIAGVAGTNGGNATPGVDLSVGTGCMILGGTGAGGSGGSNQKGGDILAVSNTPFLASAGGNVGTNGNPGFRFGQFPLFYGATGGLGGVSSQTIGGNGGPYTVGVGGGGGGTQNSGNGVAGGDGGPGLIIMAAW